MNKGLCNSCGRLVEARKERRGGRLFLVKQCGECGPTETLISGDIARYEAKRQLDTPHEYGPCALDCPDCRHPVQPNIVFVDITNRCNLNCPICINNTPSMGFLFEPPVEYFRKIFDHLAAFERPPSVQIFGGEPTVREDLFEIVMMARDAGLPTRVVTNGLRLADFEYCRGLVERRATILLSYDGADPETYRVLRGSEGALKKKLCALENLARLPRAKVSLMTLVAMGFNETALPGIFDLCNRYRNVIRAVNFMPLAHTWNRDDFDLDPARITGEDIENMVNDVFPQERVEFLPAGFLGELPTLVRALGNPMLPFGHAHPNCESMYILISDGRRFLPLSRFLRTPIREAALALAVVDKRLARREKRLTDGLTGKVLGRTLSGKLLALSAYLALANVFRRHARPGALLRGKGVGKLWHALCLPLGALFGVRSKRLLPKHTVVQGVLQLIVLPFEDRSTIETDRLQRCPSAFAFYDPIEDEVRTIPVCAWSLHKTEVMRKIATYYREAARATAGDTGKR